MILEQGDYFVVTQAACGDRSHVGRVWEAVEVCDMLVAARCVTGLPSYYDTQVLSFHLDEMEVMTVTQQYVDAVLEKRP